MSRVAIVSGGIGSPGGGGTPPQAFTITSADGAYDADTGILTLTVAVAPPSPMGSTVGGHVYLEVPDTSATGGDSSFRLGSSPVGGGRPLRGAWKPRDAGSLPYQSDQQPWVVTMPVQTQTLRAGGTPTNVRIYVSPYSADIDSPLVRANADGATPSTVITVDPNVKKPGSGSANAPNVGSVTAVALANDNGTGKLRTPIAVTVTGLPDPKPAGWGYEVCLTWFNSFPDYTDPNVGQVATGIFDVAGLVPAGPDGVAVPHTLLLDTPSSVQGGVAWIRALQKDSAGNIRRNAITPGVTPGAVFYIGVTTGTTDPTQLSNVDLNLGLDQTSGKWGILSVPMDKAINTSAEFHVDPGTGKWSMASIDLLKANLSTEFAVDGATGKWSIANVDMSKASNLSTQFTKIGSVQTITTLAADLLISGRLQIGGGKVSLAKFFDTQPTPGLIGFIGDDTTTSSNPAGTGYVGAWFKRVGIGGTLPTSPNFFADSSGNVIATSVLISDASGTAGYINSTGSWVKRLGVGGTSGAPGFYSDSAGNCVAATLYVGSASGAYGFLGAASWLKQVAIGGSSQYDSSNQIVADVNGTLRIPGGLVVGSVANATNAGTAAVFLGTVLMSQLGSGTLPVGVVYAGQINCSQLNGGTINASITLNSPTLNIAGSTFTINLDSTNGFKCVGNNTTIVVKNDYNVVGGAGMEISGLSYKSRLCPGYAGFFTLAGTPIVTIDAGNTSPLQINDSGGTSAFVFSTVATYGGLTIYGGRGILSTGGYSTTGVLCINASGQFVGAGVYTPSYGCAASGFNPYVGGAQYYGGTQTFVVGGVTFTFKGGAFISAV